MFGFKRWRPLAPGTLVFTSNSVIRGERSIVFVAHMLNGDWQFMGSDHKQDEDIVAVHFGQVMELDASVAEVVGLKRGELAHRSVGGPWGIELFFSDADLEGRMRVVAPGPGIRQRSAWKGADVLV